jgi:hypothetical protein
MKRDCVGPRKSFCLCYLDRLRGVILCRVGTVTAICEGSGKPSLLVVPCRQEGLKQTNKLCGLQPESELHRLSDHHRSDSVSYNYFSVISQLVRYFPGARDGVAIKALCCKL